MTDQEKDKFLYEKMGLCWHRWKWTQVDDGGHIPNYNSVQVCSKCGIKRTLHLNLSLATPEGFFLLWEWAKKQEWWYYFVALYHSKNSIHENKWWWETLIDPTRFRDALYEFLKEGR